MVEVPDETGLLPIDIDLWIAGSLPEAKVTYPHINFEDKWYAVVTFVSLQEAALFKLRWCGYRTSII